ncbi:MAG: FAD-binding oxidoreductase [Streptosporangiaceae bacterium]|jgi:glycolate oxidase FAD binding subunit
MTAQSIPVRLAGACSDIRLAAPADAVGGCQPSYIAAPASTKEASAVLRAAAELGLAVLPRGSGTRLHWGGPPGRCDLLVDTRRMNTVLEHAAGDLVARVQAGTGLRQLADVLGASGQRLALDPPPAGAQLPAGGAAASEGAANGHASGPGGTVGGLIATGVAGPLRLRYGTPRDLLIGITVVRPDGTVAHSGGKVVKNVAGYDLGKLYAGSWGTLGVITEAAFRLHPVPKAAAFVTLDCSGPHTAQAVLAAAVDSPLGPSAAELDWPAPNAPVSTAILLEGDPDGVAERAARLSALLGGGAVSADPPAWWGLSAAAAADGTVLRVAFWAGQTAAVLDAIAAAAAAESLRPVVSGSAAAGVLHVWLPEGAPPDSVAAFLTSLRAALRRGSAAVVHAPPAVRDHVDLWGPVPSLPLMRAVKDQFDPGHRMAAGRFVGGI